MKTCEVKGLWGSICQGREDCYVREYFLDHENVFSVKRNEGLKRALEYSRGQIDSLTKGLMYNGCHSKKRYFPKLEKEMRQLKINKSAFHISSGNSN